MQAENPKILPKNISINRPEKKTNQKTGFSAAHKTIRCGYNNHQIGDDSAKIKTVKNSTLQKKAQDYKEYTY